MYCNQRGKNCPGSIRFLLAYKSCIQITKRLFPPDNAHATVNNDNHEDDGEDEDGEDEDGEDVDDVQESNVESDDDENNNNDGGSIRSFEYANECKIYAKSMGIAVNSKTVVAVKTVNSSREKEATRKLYCNQRRKNCPGSIRFLSETFFDPRGKTTERWVTDGNPKETIDHTPKCSKIPKQQQPPPRPKQIIPLALILFSCFNYANEKC